MQQSKKRRQLGEGGAVSQRRCPSLRSQREELFFCSLISWLQFFCSPKASPLALTLFLFACTRFQLSPTYHKLLVRVSTKLQYTQAATRRFLAQVLHILPFCQYSASFHEAAFSMYKNIHFKDKIRICIFPK